jgi:hypothetical protein
VQVAVLATGGWFVTIWPPERLLVLPVKLLSPVPGCQELVDGRSHHALHHTTTFKNLHVRR